VVWWVAGRRQAAACPERRRPQPKPRAAGPLSIFATTQLGNLRYERPIPPKTAKNPLECNASEAVKKLKESPKEQNAPVGNQRLAQANFGCFQFFHSFSVTDGRDPEAESGSRPQVFLAGSGRLGEATLPFPSPPSLTHYATVFRLRRWVRRSGRPAWRARRGWRI
jgi:hypothetical protein